MRRKIIYTFIAILFVIIAYRVWFVFINYRFDVVDEGKVYKSALINPNKIDSFIVNNHIKTVIDLLEPKLSDELNPGTLDDVLQEDLAIKKINTKYHLNVTHANIPSAQLPKAKQLKAFFRILDNSSNYPVLIHCYHGTGRTELYSALYNIEYKNMSNEEARSKTRFIVESPFYDSSFASSRSKGAFLINYKKRSSPNATINNIE